ncbi:hypothetical protein Cob_v006709 [Colletotrichum orbiculare MAFF 240422]|uniref:Uncharacterized protein n=1 Tax=Colletotrichum orbiculare (strain 104-T / ATCC 96160 / CBS 514.97 / LARS 414 / MAFF 240422) TaxID=1213857 RepID=A0A484FSF3_COLOR|nr:hypothetical protein Cob_v006709 [Colletotrichum orbiculare MAFF 240422]
MLASFVAVSLSDRLSHRLFAASNIRKELLIVSEFARYKNTAQGRKTREFSAESPLSSRRLLPSWFLCRGQSRE